MSPISAPSPEPPTGAQVVAQALHLEGVRFVFVVPGEETIDLLDAISERTDICIVACRHEQHAAFMAATVGRLTGRAGVCMSTLGPGATNLATGLSQGMLGGFPIVAITGQKPARGNTQGRFQLVDVVASLKPLVKWNVSVTDGRRLASRVRLAFSQANDQRPGPTHLEIPEDIAADPIPGAMAIEPTTADPAPPNDAAIERAVEQLSRCNRPLVLLGAGATATSVSRTLQDFVEQTGLFALTTQMGKGALSEDHPQSLLALGMHHEDYVHAALEACDAMIVVGYDTVEHPPSNWRPYVDGPVVHLDGASLRPDIGYTPDVAVRGDLELTLGALGNRLEGRWTTRRWAKPLRDFLRDRFHQRPPEIPPPLPLHPLAIVAAVREAMPADSTVALDNGLYKLEFARAFRAPHSQAILLDNALATMGAGLAMGMATKMLHPRRSVCVVAGDGGFMMNLQDLETAVRFKLDLVILVVVDEAYGFIEHKQQSQGEPPTAVHFGNPDFAVLAQSFGAHGTDITPDNPDLTAAIRAGLKHGGVHVITCPVTYSQVAPEAVDVDAARATLNA